MRQFAATVLVKPEDGSVLAQHRDNISGILGPDTWAVLGGARDEKDKDLKATAIREFGEETDYVLKPEDLKFLARDVYTTEKGVQVERTIFWAKYDGKQDIHTNEGQEIRFVSPRELSNLKIYTGHEGFLRKASEKVFTSRPEHKG